MSYTDIEKVYDEFITEAKKLHGEMEQLDNEFTSPFRKIESLLEEELLNSRTQARYLDWKSKVALEFMVAVRERELYCCKLIDNWCILPLNPKVLPYGYGYEFGTLLDMLTDGKLIHEIGDDYQPYNLMEYISDSGASESDVIELFTNAIDKINRIRKDKLKVVNELTAELREHFSADALIDDCKNFISR